ncbi:hypothetical protein RRG08_038127 [Elysia crispata]|uniref:Uncharacterized protein n=1 Tax=Elysia crispata TaxID=231223 RepID=A0AAE0ZZP9_9GAST|nr:hypothetical protein RRG08_038127 [Elysia crispata]
MNPVGWTKPRSFFHLPQLLIIRVLLPIAIIPNNVTGTIMKRVCFQRPKITSYSNQLRGPLPFNYQVCATLHSVPVQNQ